MPTRNVHIVPRESGWAVRREGAERDSSRHDTKADAVETGRGTARRDGVEIVIQRKDGRIADKESYGNDPCPPRDTKH